MPSAGEIREQIERELNRRTRLAVPAFAGGFLYLLSAIIITSTLNGAADRRAARRASTPASAGVAEPGREPARGRGQIHLPSRASR